MTPIEIFTPTGVVAGNTSRPEVVQQPDLRSPVPVEKARWYPHDGSQPEHRGSVLVPPDDVLVVFVAEQEVLVHSTWYEITLEIGPYRVVGKLPTPVGFNPKKALARPGGAFVTLHDAKIRLLSRRESGVAERPTVHVSRYAVERVESDLMLGFFFPGAVLIEPPVEEPVA
jgi:hypothetical protein